MRAEDNRFPYVTVTPDAGAPSVAPDTDDHRMFVDNTEDVPLLKTIDTTSQEHPHWPVYVIPNGGTPPAGLHPKTIILEEGP